MNKRVVITVILVFLFVLVLVVPALATDEERHTSVGFRFIGDIFHDRTVTVPGGSIQYVVSGMGEVGGSHTVRSSAARAVYGEERTTIYLSTFMTGTTAIDAPPDKHVRMISEIKLLGGVELLTGVEMDPGESGYIRQSAAASSSQRGNYFKTTNHFGNTGGTTRRVNEVPGYIEDRMEVVGYANVWETTERRVGNERSGFWDKQ